MECSGPNENHPEYPLSYIGYNFVKQYYDFLSQTPEQAWRFYTESGYHLTVYEDGTSVVAETWRDVQTMLLRTASSVGKAKDDVDVDSTITVPCGPHGRMLVMATGRQFSQSFIIERQTSGKRTFAVVASSTRFLPDTETRRPPPTTVEDDGTPRSWAARTVSIWARCSTGARRSLPDLCL